MSGARAKGARRLCVALSALIAALFGTGLLGRAQAQEGLGTATPATATPGAAAPATTTPATTTPATTTPTTTTPAAVALDYSAIDRATVRVFSVHGVGTTRIQTSRGTGRLLALPESSHGSGVLVSADGLIVTARHVVEDGNLLAVWVPGHEHAFEARVVHRDDRWDLAVIAIQGTFTDFISVAPLGRSLRIREPVSAIGYPLDARRTDPQSAQGIVSGVLPSGELQLDIGVNPGNSGGPLIDGQEQVVGIVVARGNVEQGVQSIGVAVPIDPIAQLLATLGSDAPSVVSARAGLGNSEHSAEVAELVQILVRVRGSELYRDVERAMEGQGSGEVLQRLQRFADTATDAETIALLAAYFWDAAALVLERNGGALAPAQLAPGADRDLAYDLLRRAVRLCFEAQRRDPTIVSRSPFVAWVTHYIREPSARSPGQADQGQGQPPSLQSQAGQVQTGQGQPVTPPPVTPPPVRDHDTLVRERDHRLALSLDLLVSLRGPTTDQVGFLPLLSLRGSPFTLRAGPVAFDLWLGGNFAVHALDVNPRYTLVHLGAELGLSMRIGGAEGLVLAGGWTPSALIGINSGVYAALASWRARIGAQLGSGQIGAEWIGYQVENTYAMHAIGLYMEWGFLQ